MGQHVRRSAVVVLAMAVLLGVLPASPPSSAAADDWCAQPVAAPFADRAEVSEAHRTAVDCLYHLGVVRGRAGTDGVLRFLPHADVSRAQFAGMLYDLLWEMGRTDGLSTARAPGFDDVPAGHVFADQIHALANARVVNGVTTTSFAPGLPVQRDQTASLLVRAAEWSTGASLTALAGPHFGDVSSAAHRDAVDAAFEYGLVEGTRRPCGDGGGRYDPGGTMSRQQAASVLARAIGVLESIDLGEAGRRTADAQCPAPVWHPRIDGAVTYAQGRSGSVSFAAIGTDGRQVGHRSSVRVPAASVLKVMFLVAYLQQSDVRDRALEPADRALLEPMIRRSANDEATTIANRLGPGPMDLLAEQAGMQDFSYTRPWGLSTISARDQVAFLLEVDAHVPERHRDYVLQLLTEVVPSQRWGIGQVVTDGWTAHFKGGWGSGTGAVGHQVAMLEHDDGTRVAVAVMTTDSPSHEYSSATLEGVFGRILADLPSD